VVCLCVIFSAHYSPFDQLFGTLSGNAKELIQKFTVDLPKKHGRGGQSALRFSRLRDEKRHNYVRKVGELAVQHFITNDKVNVAGLVLAGSADFKTELSQSDLLDLRLQAKIIKIVDISYGMEVGWQQAIDLSSEALSNVKFVQEKKLIQKYFDEIAQDTGKYIYGVDDTLKTLELGAVETLIIWENLDLTRHVLRNAAGGKCLRFRLLIQCLTVILAEIHIVHTWPTDPKRKEKFEDKATGLEMEAAEEPQSLLEWLAEHYKEFGCALEFVSDKSQEGSQFVKGFSGIGGILRFVPFLLNPILCAYIFLNQIQGRFGDVDERLRL
jgi:peptide chain release factor subunit 1